MAVDARDVWPFFCGLFAAGEGPKFVVGNTKPFACPPDTSL